MVGIMSCGPDWARMSIARREFRAIARAIRFSALDPMGKAQAAEALCPVLKDLNYAFDPERFFVAATGFPRASWLLTIGANPATGVEHG